MAKAKLLMVSVELKEDGFCIPVAVSREAILEWKTKIAQLKLRGNRLPWLLESQNQTRVNWAEPAQTVSGRLGLYFIVVINFLPFTFSRGAQSYLH